VVQPELPLEFFSRQEQGSEYFVRALELIYSYADQHRRQPPPPQSVFDTLVAQHVATLPSDWQRQYYDGLKHFSYVLYHEPFVTGEIEFVREHTYSWIRQRAEMSLMVEAKTAIDQGQSIESVNFAKRLKQILDLLKPQQYVRMRYQEDGSELDLDVAIRSLIDYRGGATPDPRINMSHRTDGRDIAVMLLVDLSESLNEKATV
jgi:hypothetical protein